jgi:hypothetical protein
MKNRIVAVIVLAVTGLWVKPVPARPTVAGPGAIQATAGPEKPPPGIKDYGLKDYVRLSTDLPHSEDKTWKLVCEIPYNPRARRSASTPPIRWSCI